MSLEFFPHAHSVYEANVLTMSSSFLMLDKLETSRFLIMDKTSLMNNASSSLFFTIENLNELIFSSAMGIETIRRA